MAADNTARDDASAAQDVLEQAARALKHRDPHMPSAFAAQLYGRTVPEDLLHYGAGDLAMLAARAYAFFEDRAPGAPKIRWNLPGDNNTCNDFAIGPDKALYITDTANGKIYRLPSGASTAELFLEHRTLMGVDGITFLDGTMYVNNVFFNKLYRVPVDASGKAGTPVDIPSGLIAPGQYLIFSEVSYLYQPGMGYVVSKAGVTLSDTAYTRPRQSTCVLYGSQTTCPTQLADD